MRNLESGDRIELFYEDFPEAPNSRDLNRLTKSDLTLSQHISERTEAMHNMKKLILSVFIFTFGFATATHAQQVNTLLNETTSGSTG